MEIMSAFPQALVKPKQIELASLGVQLVAHHPISWCRNCFQGALEARIHSFLLELMITYNVLC